MKNLKMKSFGRTGIILLTALFCGTILFWACGSDVEAKRDTRHQEFTRLIDEINPQLSELRGLKTEQEVSYQLLSTSELRDYIVEVHNYFAENVATEQARELDDVTNRLLWVIRDRDTLNGAISDSRTASAIGSYDGDGTEVRVLYDETEPLSQTTIEVYVHEYIHYLQDQNYGLPDDPYAASGTTDAGSAYIALVEGDANHFTESYFIEYKGDLDNYPPFSEKNAFPTQTLGHKYEILSEQSFFRRIYGLDFVRAVLDANGGDNSVLDEVFMNPPRSTEQIMYPEKYIAETGEILEVGDEPVEIDPNLFAATEDWNATEFEDTLGSIFILAWLKLLNHYHSSSEYGEIVDQVKNWGGDTARLLQHSDTGDFGLQWIIAWDDRELSANQFHSFLELVPENNDEVKQVECQPDNADLVSWEYEDNVLISQVAEHPTHGKINVISVSSSCEASLELLPSP